MSMLPAYDPLSPFFRKNWVRVKNASGEEIPPFSVLRITDAPFVDNEIVYTVAKPDATYRWEYLVSWGRSIGSASTAEGFATFLKDGGPVYYNSGTPALGERWGPTASQWYLTQHRPGFHVKGATTTTFNSKSLLVATQIPPGEVRVQNDSGGAIAAGGTGTVNLFGGAAGTTDLGLELAITNGSTVSWGSTKYGWATHDAGGPVFVSPYQT